MSDHPLVSKGGNIAYVVLAIASAVKPLRITTFFDAELVRLELPHELKSGERTAGVERDPRCRVSCCVYLFTEFGRWPLVLLAAAGADAPDAPRPSPLLSPTKLRSTSNK